MAQHTDKIIAELVKILGEEGCRTDAAALKHAGRQVSHHAPGKPNAVVYPKNELEVVEIVKLCNQYGVRC